MSASIPVGDSFTVVEAVGFMRGADFFKSPTIYIYSIKVDIIVFLFGVVIVMILNIYRHAYDVYVAPTCNVYSSA